MLLREGAGKCESAKDNDRKQTGVSLGRRLAFQRWVLAAWLLGERRPTMGTDMIPCGGTIVDFGS